MRLVIDTDTATLIRETPDHREEMPLYSPGAFQLLSEQWLRVGWDQRYAYTFTWMGLPVTQIPEDLVRLQEVIWQLRPSVILETGVSRGGSMIFYASLCQAMDHGRVIGVEHRLWDSSRQALDEHPLRHRVQVIEGDSTAEDTIARVRQAIDPEESVLLVLDSAHGKDHVLRELEAYTPLIRPGHYAVVADTLMGDCWDTPRANPDWRADNARAAIEEFLATHPEFETAPPPWPFNKSPLNPETLEVSQWPGGWLRRKEATA